VSPAKLGVGAGPSDVGERAAASEQGERASTETIAQKLSAADRGSRGREVAVQPAHVVMVVVARMQRVMLLAQKEHVLS